MMLLPQIRVYFISKYMRIPGTHVHTADRSHSTCAQAPRFSRFSMLHICTSVIYRVPGMYVVLRSEYTALKLPMGPEGVHETNAHTCAAAGKCSPLRKRVAFCY